ncbi:MBL fold metallo-hydrolase RNA specificity domain-containing protein [Archaeoglobus veneficus]|uniref:Beta-lactamase domain protein n=1 Tax=Archaeoglobus veneficus (strain DSM 11195 / SNP6) TaxID=693661 RepID=F2KME9_ARCVS|nr:MBL fold metallo-hydrolase [Archaeoglobus veneficus]AEA46048.1 beta-lactamase domain protein [Archaeoglobus veneficus SNP6]
MHSLDFAEFFGFFPYRRLRGRGVSPHFSMRIGDVDFHIDSSKGDDFNLITHAHSDHHGQKNMDNPNAVASHETAAILSASTGKAFSGRTFSVGKTLRFGEVKVKTYHTGHMHGSTAFYFDNGVLVTGDVKDYRGLPKCSVLIAEATYGSPEHIFEDEVERLVEEAPNSVLGAYPVGKAQRVAEILTNAGYSVAACNKISRICMCLGIEVDADDGEVFLVPPRELPYVRRSGRRYVLTAQNFYSFPRIVLSDHLDYEGILRMVEHCNPEHVIFYHGNPSECLIQELESMGYEVTLLHELEKVKVRRKS